MGFSLLRALEFFAFRKMEMPETKTHLLLNCTPNVGHEKEFMYNIWRCIFYVKNHIRKTLSQGFDCPGNQ